ncbi:hypothetical protein SH139x_000458 [Planctomycetaceae bacterium SH139]
MMKRTLAALAVCGLLTTATVWAAEKADIKWEDIKCVMAPNKGANPEKSSEYKDGKVYFCCDGCKGKFDKDKDKFALRANHQLVSTKQYKQKACPLSGGDVNPDKMVKVGGVEVGFCCGNCQGKVAKAEGDDQLKLVFGADAFKKGFDKVKKED